MTNANPVAMLRSLIVYAVCVPLAMVVGYLLTNLDYQAIGVIGVVAALLIFPILMKWHYPLLIMSIGLPATLFFLPGRPSIFVTMVAVSFTISMVERILNRNQPFLTPAAVAWPLIALLAVIILTAKLTGGFGLRSMGSDVYGGKKYVVMIIGILSFFALTARPIPRKQVNTYITLYCLSGVFSLISDMYSITPKALSFIFYVFAPSYDTMDSTTRVGVTRLAGIAGAAGAILSWMLARHGFRENFLTGKIWRPIIFGLMTMVVLLGGFRSSMLNLILLLGMLFVLEKMYRTGLMLIVVLGGLMIAALVVPLAPHLPYTFQRALAFLPLEISPAARMDADGSTQWRLDMWAALLPQVPKYLLLGKGFAFSPEVFNNYMGFDAQFYNTKSIDAADNPLALSSDFHSGPLSVVLSFGIWGVLAWLWYWAAGLWVMWRNYKYGDPELGRINMYLFVVMVSKCFSFLFIFGGIVEDVGGFATIIGFSVALNHGVMRPKPRRAFNPPSAKPRLNFPASPVLQP